MLHGLLATSDFDNAKPGFVVAVVTEDLGYTDPDRISVRIGRGTSEAKRTFRLDFVGEHDEDDGSISEDDRGFIVVKTTRDITHVATADIDQDLPSGTRRQLRAVTERFSRVFMGRFVEDKPARQRRQPSLPSAASAASMIKRAVKEHGTTSSLTGAGFILPDGELLDLAYGGTVRADDHRVVGAFVPASVSARCAKTNYDRTCEMMWFIAAGPIRVIASGSRDNLFLGLTLVVEPTVAQIRTIRAWMPVVSEVSVDISDIDANTIETQSFQGRRAGAAIEWMRAHFANV